MLRTTPTNQASAAAGSIAFEAYQHAKGLTDDLPRQFPQETLTDLLADLRHFAAVAEIDFESAVRMSECHYEEESS